jgi:hypothetical protein
MHTKITRVPDYDDADVNMPLDSSVSIFLVPSLKLWEGRGGAQENYSANFWRKKDIYIFGHFVKQVPREFTRTDQFADYWASPTGHAGQIGGSWPVTSVLDDDTIRTAWYDLFTSQAEAATTVFHYSQWFQAWAATGFVTQPDVNSYLDGGDFGDVISPSFVYALGTGGLFGRTGNLPPGNFSSEGYVLDEPYVRWVGWYKKAGQLLAVVNKPKGTNAGWYYIWNTRDSDTVSTNPNLNANIPNLGTIYARTWNPTNWFGGQDRGVTLRPPGQ